MKEINNDIFNIDVIIIISANGMLNPSTLNNYDSLITGIAALEIWHNKTKIALKLGMLISYLNIDNLLFSKENTRMLFGDSKTSVDALLVELS